VEETQEQAEGTDLMGREGSRDTGNMFLSGKGVHICFSLLWYGIVWGTEGPEASNLKDASSGKTGFGPQLVYASLPCTRRAVRI